MPPPALCLECGKPLEPEELAARRRLHAACVKEHAKRMHREAARAYQKRHREQGLCLQCPREAVKGSLCEEHYQKAKARINRKAGRRI